MLQLSPDRRILDPLESGGVVGRDPIEQAIAVIVTARNKCMNQFIGGCSVQIFRILLMFRIAKDAVDVILLT